MGEGKGGREWGRESETGAWAAVLPSGARQFRVQCQTTKTTTKATTKAMQGGKGSCRRCRVVVATLLPFVRAHTHTHTHRTSGRHNNKQSDTRQCCLALLCSLRSVASPPEGVKLHGHGFFFLFVGVAVNVAASVVVMCD